MRNTLSALFGIAVLACAARAARADNSTCDNAVLLTPDGSIHEQDVPDTPLFARKWFSFVAKANRSYAIMLENLTSPDIQPALSVSDAFEGCGGSRVPIDDTANLLEPVACEITPAGICVGGIGIALKSPGNTILAFSVQREFSSAVTGPFRLRVRVVETTQFSPTWSTADGFETFYRIYNTADGTVVGCSVTLDLRKDSDGPAAGVSSAVTFTLMGNQSVTRRTGPSDMGVIDGQTGHAIITHDCTPGAIQVEAYMSGPAGYRIPLKVVTARQQR